MDNNYKQMCYEICTPKSCSGTNVNTLHAPAFVGTHKHVDYRPHGEVPDAVHAFICIMAPRAETAFIKTNYPCVPAKALNTK